MADEMIRPSQTMRALSLWQPWASLWLSPAKVNETRRWPTRIRGMIVVHAAKTHEGMDGCLDDLLKKYFGLMWHVEIPFGALIGTVNLIDCISTDSLMGKPVDKEDERCGNFGPGRYLFRRDSFRRFAEPIPWRGAQGFFSVPSGMIINAKSVSCHG